MNKSFFLLILFLVLVSCDKDEPKEYVFFLVEDVTGTHDDSYILPLTTQADIEQARAILANPDEFKIIVAEITKKNSPAHYYPNKDLNNDREWSWHVSKFIGFADITVEIYDGWPEYVEDHYDAWVENTKNENGNGVIGFWNYTVTREVDLRLEEKTSVRRRRSEASEGALPYFDFLPIPN